MYRVETATLDTQTKKNCVKCRRAAMEENMEQGQTQKGMMFNAFFICLSLCTICPSSSLSSFTFIIEPSLNMGLIFTHHVDNDDDYDDDGAGALRWCVAVFGVCVYMQTHCRSVFL